MARSLVAPTDKALARGGEFTRTASRTCERQKAISYQLNSIVNLDFAAPVKPVGGDNSARLVSLLYRAKETGELPRHTILLNVNRQRMLTRDLAALAGKLPELSGRAQQACKGLLANVSEAVTTGQNSPAQRRVHAPKSNFLAVNS